jgi:hypothetical protein
MTNPSWRISNELEKRKKEEEKKMPFIVATKGSASTPLGPIFLPYSAPEI